MTKKLLLLLILLLVACHATTPSKTTLILATTTSTQDSGLLDLLIPIFQAESGYTVQTVAVGTGAALKMAEEGNADVLLVHAPDAEKALMATNDAKDRLLVMHNDFVLVGNSADSANVRGLSIEDSLAQIASSAAPFISRGDDSGTNKKELSIWDSTAFNPNGEKPDWYIESGQGMGATLIIASEKSAYTLTDRATFLANQANLNLDILVEGDAVLLNVYHVMTVNPEKWTETNYDGALAFAEFLTNDTTQALIAQFGMNQYGQPLFFPDAGKTDADLGLE